ncbi:hypothetical protein GALMADRAFT_1204136 [Galerina marginata CBS 339.88]|uniref:Uncharacterized protein n=1 Tax=Galerina marginata (strain CBS 339.88) TaxID=685588 RepID=A0A067SEK6_GALM3|nr:hypothetical protein GALMADRAFT_1204136 [Galerina marginata CBS 339.88]
MSSDMVQPRDGSGSPITRRQPPNSAQPEDVIEMTHLNASSTPNASNQDEPCSVKRQVPPETPAGAKPRFKLYQTAREMYQTLGEDFPLAFNSFLVMTGICIMLAGTFVVRVALLPKIYTCPDGATCHHNLDPRGDIIPRLSTLMQYWLQGGVFVSGLGLSRFIAYESWTLVNGRTVRNLEREISAVDGSISASLVLFFKPMVHRNKIPPNDSSHQQSHGPRFLGTFALIQFGIGFFISLVVGFSIADLQGTRSVYVPFTYHSNFAIPRQDLRYISNGEYIVLNQLTNWFLYGSGSHRPTTVFDGTLVLRDNRTLSATNPQPSGSRIAGTTSCGKQGWDISVLSLDSPYLADDHGALSPGEKAYNLTNGTFWFVTYSHTHLSSIFLSFPELSDSVTSRPYLWASNTSNVVPNATASSDGGMHFAVCNHTTRLVGLPPVDKPGAQNIFPSQPIIYTDASDPFLNSCPSTDPMACLSRFIDETVIAFWQPTVVQYDLVPFSCVTDVLVGYDGLSDTPDCALDDSRWTTTLSTVLDAFIYTAEQSGNATQIQYLSATTNSININRWWIQTTLPGATFLLYLACLAFYRNSSPTSRSNYKLRELALSDILYKAELPLPKPDMTIMMQKN